MTRPDRETLRTILTTSTDSGVTPAIVIVMAYAIHIGDLALRHLQHHPDVWAVANGLSAWETEVMRARYGNRVLVLGRTYDHSDIIDALTAILKTPFWLVDHDCYMLDTAVLAEHRPDLTGRAGEAWFRSFNARNGLTLPATFLLRLNPSVIRKVRRAYGVSSRTYWWTTLPDRARDRLLALGLHEGRMPESSKDYFDTLRVIALLAEADGCGFAIARNYSDSCARHPEVIHIGATSWPNWPPVDRYGGIGAYFWKRLLEACPMPRARTEYEAQWPDVPDADSMRHVLEASGVLTHDDSPELLDFLDALAHGRQMPLA